MLLHIRRATDDEGIPHMDGAWLASIVTGALMFIWPDSSAYAAILTSVISAGKEKSVRETHMCDDCRWIQRHRMTPIKDWST